MPCGAKQQSHLTVPEGRTTTIGDETEILYFIIPFSLGLLAGIISISLLVNFLFKSYQEQTFSIILGISLSTIITLLIRLIPYITGIPSLIISIIILTIGYFLTNKLI